MREIKFRGKDKYNNWVRGDLIHGVFTKKGNLYILPLEHNLTYIPNCHYLDGVKIENETICQCTGVKDKNGVEIYEGDILKDNNDIIIVLWNDKYAGFTLHCENWSGLSFFYEDIYPENCEIIGNIHDNLQLLNK